MQSAGFDDKVRGQTRVRAIIGGAIILRAVLNSVGGWPPVLELPATHFHSA